MKRFACVLLAAASLIWISCSRTDGFSLSNIQGPLVMQEAPSVSCEIQEILSQPFRYLSKGRQCFVFESLDGKYVLKFFNQKYLQMPWYGFLVKEKERAKRALRRHFYENSYEIACRELGEGILYLHLGPSEELPLTCVVDKAKRQYKIDLNQIPFVLQKKGAPFYPTLEAIYQEEGIEGLYKQIDLFLEAIQKRISKNIADGDRNVENNWGYLEGQIFHLDPGRLYYEDLSEPARRKEEWNRATQSFQKWLESHHPEAAKYLAGHLATQ